MSIDEKAFQAAFNACKEGPVHSLRAAIEAYETARSTERESSSPIESDNSQPIDQPIETAPRDGSRMRLLHQGIEVHGWYEEGFGFLGMDSEWNLVRLNPTAWAPLQEQGRRGRDDA